MKDENKITTMNSDGIASHFPSMRKDTYRQPLGCPYLWAESWSFPSLKLPKNCLYASTKLIIYFEIIYVFVSHPRAPRKWQTERFTQLFRRRVVVLHFHWVQRGVRLVVGSTSKTKLFRKGNRLHPIFFCFFALLFLRTDDRSSLPWDFLYFLVRALCSPTNYFVR